MGNPHRNYRLSLTNWDHTVLPRHPTQTNRPAGTQFTYPKAWKAKLISVLLIGRDGLPGLTELSI